MGCVAEVFNQVFKHEFRGVFRHISLAFMKFNQGASPKEQAFLDHFINAKGMPPLHQQSYGGAGPQSNYGSGGFAPPAIPSSTGIAPPCKNCPRSRNPGKNPKTGKFWDTCCFACGTGKVHHPSDHDAKCKARNSSKMYQKSSYGGAVPQSNYGSGGFAPPAIPSSTVIAPPCKNCPRSRNRGKNPKTGKFWDTCCFACGTGKVHHASDHDAKCKARNSSKMYQKSSYGGAVPQSNYGSGGFAPPAIPS